MVEAHLYHNKNTCISCPTFVQSGSALLSPFTTTKLKRSKLEMPRSLSGFKIS